MTPDDLLKYWPIISTLILAAGGAVKWVVSILRELDEEKAEHRVWESIARDMLPVLHKSERIAKEAANELIAPATEEQP